MNSRQFPYVQLDVFSSTPLEGNMLAVFHDAQGLSDDEMQAIARETNLSETTFIVPRDADWAVVNLIDDNDVVRAVAAYHRDPAQGAAVGVASLAQALILFAAAWFHLATDAGPVVERVADSTVAGLAH